MFGWQQVFPKKIKVHLCATIHGIPRPHSLFAGSGCWSGKDTSHGQLAATSECEKAPRILGPYRFLLEICEELCIHGCSLDWPFKKGCIFVVCKCTNSFWKPKTSHDRGSSASTTEFWRWFCAWNGCLRLGNGCGFMPTRQPYMLLQQEILPPACWMLPLMSVNHVPSLQGSRNGVLMFWGANSLSTRTNEAFAS